MPERYDKISVYISAIPLVLLILLLFGTIMVTVIRCLL